MSLVLVGLLALTSAVAISTGTASAVTSYVDGAPAPVKRSCQAVAPPHDFRLLPVAYTTVDVWRNEVARQPVASAKGGTVNTFYVRFTVSATFGFNCSTGPMIPLLTLPAGVHIDTSPTFSILCTFNGTAVPSESAACPGKKNLVRSTAGGPLEYHSSFGDAFWPFQSTVLAADTYVFEFPVYADRVFTNRSISASVTMTGTVATPATVSARVFRPALTCDGKAVTVAAQFGEASTSGNDVISGGPGNDRISGGFGNDLICGGAGNDTIDGGPGNDTINGGLGKDDMSGGTGVDTLDYTGRSAVRVNLGAFGYQNTGGAGYDRVGDFENIIGTNGSDSLTGNDANNVLRGGLGNDRLAGGPGKDTLSGGGGTDTCDGGTGADTAVSCEIRTGFP
jgi:hypothetical protein